MEHAQVSAPDAGPLLGGRYRLAGRIGVGGMATIHRATDEALGREVAVKVLHPHLADDADVLARFRTEARSAAALTHPNVVAVFDVGPPHPPAGPYLVMELVDGPSLRQVLAARGRLDPAEALRIVAAVCRALGLAHARGIVHRDVKPENVLVAADGTPKLADFGIARALSETGHTAVGSLVGSLDYLAPELAAGGHATPASDQYAVGVLAFELLTGRRPPPITAAARRPAGDETPAPGTLVAGIPLQVDALVRRATARDPDARYPDIGAMAADLRAAAGMDGGAATAQRGSGTRRDTLVIPPATRDTERLESADELDPRVGERPAPRVRWAGVVAAGLAGVLLLLAVGFGLWRAAAPPPTAPMPALVGQPEQPALDALADAGVSVAVHREHDDAARGRVIGQDPEPGTEVRPGEQASIVVSLGVERVRVPDLGRRSAQQARAALDDAGLAADVEEVYSDATPQRGQVVAQSPEPGAQVDAGSVVELRVSRGPLTVRVPDVLGDDVADAAAQLEAMDLEVRVVEEPRPGIGPLRVGRVGRVESTDPAPGEDARRGEPVQLRTYVDD